KKTPVPSTSSCSQHESTSDLNQNIIIIDRDDEETQYAIVHVEDIEDNIQKAPNNQSVDRSNVICEKELELANIKINHEIEICKLRKEREEFINELTIRKLLLEEKELKERVKLAKFRAQKEM
ncbi:cap-gly domain-containing linker protein, partial [Lasius niger]